MSRTETTPSTITAAISKFCEEISPRADLQYIPVRPWQGCAPNECYPNVDAVIKKHGGSMIVGRVIWQWANIMLEAEAHAIWKTVDGEYVDITPHNYDEKQILFLFVPGMVYEGISIRSIRKALTDSLLVKELLVLRDKYEDFTCSSSERMMEATPEFLQTVAQYQELVQLIKRPAGRNELCPCGSGIKFKRCCGN